MKMGIETTIQKCLKKKNSINSDSNLISEKLERPASFAGSWYPSNSSILFTKMTEWIENAERRIVNWPSNPPKIIIVPHAGYSYSAPTAAFGYCILRRFKSNYKRIILLGPSHKVYLTPSIQSSSYQLLSTPFGSLSTVQNHDISAIITKFSHSVDIQEHCLEMQFPFIKFIYQNIQDDNIEILPLLVSNHEIHSSPPLIQKELLKFLKDQDSLFILSSDFCHWGRNYDYIPLPSLPSSSSIEFIDNINKFIDELDNRAMNAIEGGYESFKKYLQETKNTICGREVILLTLKMIEQLAKEKNDSNMKLSLWNWISYTCSSKITDLKGNRVSYVSGYY